MCVCVCVRARVCICGLRLSVCVSSITSISNNPLQQSSHFDTESQEKKEALHAALHACKSNVKGRNDGGGSIIMPSKILEGKRMLSGIDEVQA